MAKSKSSPKVVEPDSTESNGVVATNKSAMFREAIGTLGLKAEVAAIIDWVKAKHGVELAPGMVSQYRSLARQKTRGFRKRGKKIPAAVPAIERKVKVASTGTDSLLDFVRAVQNFRGKLGTEEMKKVIDVVCG